MRISDWSSDVCSSDLTAPYRRQKRWARCPRSGNREVLMPAPFDPVTLELVWRRLISSVDEAAAALVRTSFSTLVREYSDFSCIITDDRGESLEIGRASCRERVCQSG